MDGDHNFKISVRRDDATDVKTVVVGGYVGINETAEMARVLDSAVDREAPLVVVEMADVRFLCSSAIGKLLSAVGEARSRGGEVVFAAIPPKIRTVFVYLDILDYIRTADDRAGAVEKLKTFSRATSVRTSADLEKALQKAAELNKKGELEEAGIILKNILEKDPGNLKALVWYADTMEKAGEYEYAWELFSQATELSPAGSETGEYARKRLAKLRRSEPAARSRAVEKVALSFIDYADFFEDVDTFRRPERSVTTRAGRFFLSVRPVFEDAKAAGRKSRDYGGFFLSVDGFGVVIDPGAAFVEYFSRVSGTVGDIDALVVTRFAESADGDLVRVLEAAAAKKTKLAVYVSRNVYKYYYTWLSDFKNVLSGVHMIRPGRVFTLNGVRFIPGPVQYHERLGGKEALGLMVEAEGFSVGYLGDFVSVDPAVFDEWMPARDGLLVIGLTEVHGSPRRLRRLFKDELKVLSVVKPRVALCAGPAVDEYAGPFAEELGRLAGVEVVVGGTGTAFDLSNYSRFHLPVKNS